MRCYHTIPSRLVLFLCRIRSDRFDANFSAVTNTVTCVCGEQWAVVRVLRYNHSLHSILTRGSLQVGKKWHELTCKKWLDNTILIVAIPTVFAGGKSAVFQQISAGGWHHTVPLRLQLTLEHRIYNKRAVTKIFGARETLSGRKKANCHPKLITNTQDSQIFRGFSMKFKTEQDFTDTAECQSLQIIWRKLLDVN